MPSRNTTLAGIAMMLLGILLFSLNDVMGKWLVATYTVGQVLLLRSAAALLVIIPFVVKQGVGRTLRPERPGRRRRRVRRADLADVLQAGIDNDARRPGDVLPRAGRLY